MRSEWLTIAAVTVASCFLGLAVRSLCQGVIVDLARHKPAQAIPESQGITPQRSIDDEQQRLVTSALSAAGCNPLGGRSDGLSAFIRHGERYRVEWIVAPYCYRLELRGNAEWEDVEREFEPVLAAMPETRYLAGAAIESTGALGRDVKEVAEGWVLQTEVSQGRKCLLLCPRKREPSRPG